MSRPKYKCCNPLQKKKHNSVYFNLNRITENWDTKFKPFIGLYVCNSCKARIYEDSFVFKPQIPKTIAPKKENLNDKIEIDVDDEKSDPTVKYDKIDDTAKIESINKVLKEFGEPLIKKKRLSDVATRDKENISNIFNKIRCDENVNAEKQYIANIKKALSEKSTHFDKIQVLTTLPESWTINKIHQVFEV